MTQPSKITGILLWKRVHYLCPNCSANLISSLRDVGGVVECPDCESEIIIPSGKPQPRHCKRSAKQKKKVVFPAEAFVIVFYQGTYPDLIVFDQLIAETCQPIPGATVLPIQGSDADTMVDVMETIKQVAEKGLHGFRDFSQYSVEHWKYDVGESRGTVVLLTLKDKPTTRVYGPSGQGADALARVLCDAEARKLAGAIRRDAGHGELVSLARSFGFSPDESSNIVTDMLRCADTIRTNTAIDGLLRQAIDDTRI